MLTKYDENLKPNNSIKNINFVVGRKNVNPNDILYSCHLHDWQHDEESKNNKKDKKKQYTLI